MGFAVERPGGPRALTTVTTAARSAENRREERV
jgi:hypothetical protein